MNAILVRPTPGMRTGMTMAELTDMVHDCLRGSGPGEQQCERCGTFAPLRQIRLTGSEFLCASCRGGGE